MQRQRRLSWPGTRPRPKRSWPGARRRPKRSWPGARRRPKRSWPGTRRRPKRSWPGTRRRPKRSRPGTKWSNLVNRQQLSNSAGGHISARCPCDATEGMEPSAVGNISTRCSITAIAYFHGAAARRNPPNMSGRRRPSQVDKYYLKLCE